ncbi:MAG: ABC transporter ATP-binding protein [Alphaproteobacteria bacterium]|jgi:branched-chain amino acid transport system ATP-binding protein|nr:ABC transporter ATP-binding protein [Alphaproteobacteria bacterium]
MAENLLTVEGLFAGYDGQPVLRDLTFDVPKGALIALIGPNGHGKTTLMRCIAGLLKPTTGKVEFSGKKVTGLPAEEMVSRGVVLIPQGDMLFPDMSVVDNLRMGAFLPAARAKFSENVEEIYGMLPRLKERSSQMARTLSGGERRMLAIGRGLLSGGEILLLDEPSLGLAPIVIDQIYEIIENLRKQGRTILLVEESPNRIIDLADHIHLLDTGSIVWDGTGQELQAQPQILETYLGG